jgi:tRNA threonylcarbamoyl adenosine modification protein YeaZ
VLVLAVDTSAAVVSVALADVAGDTVEILAARDVAAANRHGELLAATVADVLGEASVEVSALAAVAAGLGPGPFTGLRVGVVTAATLSDALGVPAYGTCSLDALARAVAADRPLLVCTDARRKQVYWARYDATGARVEGPDIATAVAVADRFAGVVPLVAGVGASMYADDLRAFERAGQVEYASAGDVIRLVAQRVRSQAPSDVMEPMYLRRPDAQPPGRPKSVLPA